MQYTYYGVIRYKSRYFCNGVRVLQKYASNMYDYYIYLYTCVIVKKMLQFFYIKN